jgi:NADPH:quinone reductase-like Zn-dependent oxidoreductase
MAARPASATAIQMARAKGARVFATAGSAEKCQACEALGAERAINYRERISSEIVKQATNGKGADVILDMVGGGYIQRNMLMLPRRPHYQYRFLEGSKPRWMLPMMMKRLRSPARPCASAASPRRRKSPGRWRRRSGR